MNKRIRLILLALIGLAGVSAVIYLAVSARPTYVEGRPTMVFFHAGN